MTEFPSNISDNIRTVAPQDAITAGFFALRDMDPDAVCPNNRERFARQCDHCIAEAVISAAYPLITARVRAEGEQQFAEAERILEQAIRERDEAEEWADKLAAALAGDAAGEHSSANNPWQNALDIAADHDARVRAEERQRCIAAIDAVREEYEALTVDAMWSGGMRRAVTIIAAGSAVPVATPQCTMALTQLLAEYRDGDEQGWEAEFEWLRREHASQLDTLATSIQETGIRVPILLGTDGRVWDGHHRLCVASMLGLDVVPVEVATPTDPVDEVKCPGCEATIRARMSDRSTPERGAALEDLEHALTLALQAMAENDCCADEDDPDWRGPAIEQFRQDLRALGVRDAEMDAVGIKAPAEQDGQR